MLESPESQLVRLRKRAGAPRGGERTPAPPPGKARVGVSSFGPGRSSAEQFRPAITRLGYLAEYWPWRRQSTRPAET
jgi:hypothetical protein